MWPIIEMLKEITTPHADFRMVDTNGYSVAGLRRQLQKSGVTVVSCTWFNDDYPVDGGGLTRIETLSVCVAEKDAERAKSVFCKLGIMAWK